MQTAIRTLLISLLAVQASLPGRAQTPPPSTDAWPQFRGNPKLTGVAPVAPPTNLKLLWKYEAGDLIDSSAAIANNVVYVGVGSGELIAIDLAAGTLKWKYSTKNLIGESSPTVGPDAVYIGDLAGMVHAVAPGDGKPLWTFKTGGEIKSSPILLKDLVLIGSYDGHLYALESRTGRLKWKVVTEGPVHATPAVLGDLVFIAGCDEKFRAIRISDGKQEYEIVSGAYTGASPVLDGDRAYFGTFNYEVLALDLKGRKVVWRYRDPSRSFPFYSSAALSNGRIIVGGRDKMIHAIDAASGKGAWTFATRARVDSSPAVAGGRVYVGSNDGRLYVLDLATGQKQWEFDAGAAITASPAISGGRVVVGTQDGVIYAFG